MANRGRSSDDKSNCGGLFLIARVLGATGQHLAAAAAMVLKHWSDMRALRFASHHASERAPTFVYATGEERRREGKLSQIKRRGG